MREPHDNALRYQPGFPPADDSYPQKLRDLMKTKFLVAMAWLISCGVALACTGTQLPSETTVIEDPDEELLEEPSGEDGWQSLRQGDLAAAEEVFASLVEHPQGQAQGLAGLLRLAQIREDVDEIKALLEEAEVASRLALLDIVAAQTASQIKSPSAARWLERGCEHIQHDRFAHDARSLCARQAWHIASPEGTNCAAGCDAVHDVSLGLIGSLPIVLASINDQEETPFIVDTGASTCVIARQYAEEYGIESIQGTGYEATSAAGVVEAHLAAVDLQIAELRQEDISCTVLEFPVEGIAGIISPQRDLRDFAVTMNFHEMTLEIAPPEQASTLREVVELPLLVDQGVLQLMAAVGERPTRPFLLDTGADRSRLHIELDQMGQPLNRGEETVALAAGGEVRSWPTEGRLTAAAQALSWDMVDPVVYESAPLKSQARMHWQGYIGMDVLLGRKLRVDPTNQKISISSESQLSPWSDGSAQTIEVRGVRWPDPVRITEQVAEHDGNRITLNVIIDAHEEVLEEFSIAFEDTWTTRETWLVTRPVETYWQLVDGEKVEQDPATAVQRFLPYFLPFEMTGVPSVDVEVLSLPDGDHLCTRIQANAVALLDEPVEATLSMWQCQRPWRTPQIELRSTKEDELLWGFEVVEQQ